MSLSTRVMWLLAGVALFAGTGGCARAYHAYPCGCVPYGYCAEPPLPHVMYCGCCTAVAARVPQAPSLERGGPSP
jgi:hypothetical protein